MKYTYSVESFYLEKWLPIIRSETRDFCTGYLQARSDYAPRNAYRIIRSDGKPVHELPAALEVSIGQVAGFPTPEQYESAAKRALEQAARIRAQQARLETHRSSFRQNNS